MQELIGITTMEFIFCIYVAGLLWAIVSVYNKITNEPEKLSKMLEEIEPAGAIPRKVIIWLSCFAVTIVIILWPIILVKRIFTSKKGK